MKSIKTHTNSWTECSKHKSGNGINKENPNWGENGTEKFGNSERNLRSKLHHRIQEMEGWILDIKDKIEEMETSVKENVKSKK